MKPTKGHWPKGKRRNPEARLLIAKLRRLLHYPKRGLISQRAIAKELEVNARSVGRWLQEEDCPSLQHQKNLKTWIDKIGQK